MNDNRPSAQPDFIQNNVQAVAGSHGPTSSASLDRPHPAVNDAPLATASSPRFYGKSGDSLESNWPAFSLDFSQLNEPKYLATSGANGPGVERHQQ